MTMEKPIFWHQGLFLQPQHFQLNDLHHQSLLTPVHQFLTPYFWGVGKLEISTAALDNFSFTVTRGRFLFVDNTFAEYPGNAVIQSRLFQDAWKDGGKGFPVYLGLKKWNRDGANVTVVSDLKNLTDVNTRFVAATDSSEVKDLYQDGPPAKVKQLYYVLKLFWASEKDQLGEYELIPLGRLERDGDNVTRSIKTIPPCISIAGSETLMAHVIEIRDQLTARCRQLEEYKRDRGIQTAEFGARDMVYLLALRSLNRYVPRLVHITEAGEIHPWHVYDLLRQLIGELSSFSQNISVLGKDSDGTPLLPAYDHVNLGRCFSAAQSLATRLLDDITAGPDHAMSLTYDGTYFASDLPPAVFEGGNRYFLLVQTEADSQATIHSISTIAKVSARESLPILIARSLSGVRLDHMETPPQELPRRANALYFQLDHHGDQWAQVQKRNNVALYWDSAPDDLKIELMVVGRT